MGLTEKISKMLGEGKTEQEIALSLQQQGYDGRDIAESISQARIKNAVYTSPYDVQGNTGASMTTSYPNNQGMQQSVMSIPPASEAAQTEEVVQGQSMAQAQQYVQPQNFYPEYQQYPQPQYEDRQYSSNADVISEIAEQVVSEKLSSLRTSLEAVYNLKTSLESKMESLEERLRRIEKLIDRLQLSVLQKVGDYLTNVDDIKKELIETQKSFKFLMEKNKPDSQNALNKA